METTINDSVNDKANAKACYRFCPACGARMDGGGQMKRKDKDYTFLEVWVFEDARSYGYVAVQASFEGALKEAENFCSNHNIDMESKEKIFSFEFYRNGKMIDEKRLSPDEILKELRRRKKCDRRAQREPFPKRKQLSQSV